MLKAFRPESMDLVGVEADVGGPRAGSGESSAGERDKRQQLQGGQWLGKKAFRHRPSATEFR